MLQLTSLSRIYHVAVSSRVLHVVRLSRVFHVIVPSRVRHMTVRSCTGAVSPDVLGKNTPTPTSVAKSAACKEKEPASVLVAENEHTSTVDRITDAVVAPDPAQAADNAIVNAGDAVSVPDPTIVLTSAVDN